MQFFTLPNKYTNGQRLRISAEWRDAGALVDPSTVRFKYKPPSAADTTTLLYGVDAALVKDAVGQYHVDLDLDDDGTWSYRYEAVGGFQGAYQNKFKVTAKLL